MKIALVYDLIYPYNYGGVEWRYFSLAKHLRLKGHEVHLYGVKNWSGKNVRKVVDGVYIHGIGTYKNFTGERKPLEVSSYAIRLGRELHKNKFDLVDCTAFPYLPALVCNGYCKQNKIPLIVTWHEVWDEYWKAKG